MEPVQSFEEILTLIRQARYRALQSVNRELIDLYWQVGQSISEKVTASQWGKAVVKRLADTIKNQYPDLGGFY